MSRPGDCNLSRRLFPHSRLLMFGTDAIRESCGPRPSPANSSDKPSYLWVHVDDEGLAGRRRGSMSASINAHVQHQQNRKRKAAALRRLKPVKTNAIVRHDCPGRRRSSGNRTLQGIQQKTPDDSPSHRNADVIKPSSFSEAPRLVVRRKSPPDLVVSTHSSQPLISRQTFIITVPETKVLIHVMTSARNARPSSRWNTRSNSRANISAIQRWQMESMSRLPTGNTWSTPSRSGCWGISCLKGLCLRPNSPHQSWTHSPRPPYP